MIAGGREETPVLLRILAVGPARQPVTGQSVAFWDFVDESTLDVVAVGYPPWHGVIGHVRFLAALLRALVRRSKFDAVYLTTSRSHIGFFRDLLVVLLFARRLPVINHLHGADFRAFRECASPPFRWLIDVVYRGFATSIVLCESMKDQYEAYPGTRLVAVPNGIGCGTWQAIREAVESTQRDSRSDLHVLFLSNLIREKGVLELVDAVKTMVAAGHRIRLTIAGGAGYSKMVDHRITHLPESRVQWVGSVRGSAKARLLANADVVALPSYYRRVGQITGLLT